MKAMIINSYGASDVFEPADIPKPNVRPGHMLVKIAATSVNTVDTMIRQMGKELPLSPDLPALLGMDFAGTVEEVGEGVSSFNVGDEVYSCRG
ncbi:alcohol dehydrogenase catalytic domain-containing protein [Microbulbifer elongatus]|uniref:alcohol dehydrogenase catalytic domain-containing protein n=1 Tax=Microbulbifer elongatus TaxID=86173 RepID=UPI001CFCB09D|nr:alcohol dehydrogenase catalytic domain-containing protein [Microbulbifer elongatus]